MEVLCHPDAFTALADAFETMGLVPESKQATRIPTNMIDLDADTARQLLKLMEALDDHDDVQNVSANFNIPDEAMVVVANE